MGSYSGTILPAQRSPGMDALTGAANMYSKAMMTQAMADASETRKSDKQAKNMAKFEAFAKANGKDLKYGYGPGGLTASTVEQKDPTIADLQVGAAGALPANKYAQIGKNMGIAPVTLPADQNPDAAMSMIDGSVGNAQEQPVAPVAQDYGQTVMNALRKNPMVNRPGRQVTQLPSDFANDFKVAHDTAAGDPDKFVNNLKDVGLKYADNPVALAQIKRLIDLNKTKKSGRPSRK